MDPHSPVSARRLHSSGRRPDPGGGPGAVRRAVSAPGWQHRDRLRPVARPREAAHQARTAGRHRRRLRSGLAGFAVRGQGCKPSAGGGDCRCDARLLAAGRPPGNPARAVTAAACGQTRVSALRTSANRRVRPLSVERKGGSPWRRAVSPGGGRGSPAAAEAGAGCAPEGGGRCRTDGGNSRCRRARCRTAGAAGGAGADLVFRVAGAACNRIGAAGFEPGPDSAGGGPRGSDRHADRGRKQRQSRRGRAGADGGQGG